MYLLYLCSNVLKCVVIKLYILILYIHINNTTLHRWTNDQIDTGRMHISIQPRKHGCNLDCHATTTKNLQTLASIGKRNALCLRRHAQRTYSIVCLIAGTKGHISQGRMPAGCVCLRWPRKIFLNKPLDSS